VTVAARNARAVLESVQGDPALGRVASRLLREIAQFEQDLPALRRNLRQMVMAVPIGAPRLIFRAMGKAHVLVEGRPVTGAEWESRVAREVTFCLLAHPDGLTKEVLASLIWPDQSPDVLQNEFKSTLRRLRNVLGREAVLHDESIYCFNHALDYEYDVHAFEEKIKQARAASEPLARAAAYQAAIDLYGGPFLPGIYSEWVLPERERLQHVFIEAALALAELYLDTRQYKAALAICERILVEDPFIEEACSLSMRAYAATGNLAAVTRKYERCRQALSKDAHVPLSPETVALYESLMHR
jgi:LuxR family maltose regulon positive regulatory protein